ncbi:DinB family protein [Chitinophaga sp. HK235]|uniref:DinB family protein n=1 Tax=Chitinophaga sp. HK235 TaxID=2952571 RepID=UPI001BA7096A|nr:DinB family protein [Chitinophaga sp. HK235]
MKEILVRFASYNHWANQQLVAVMLNLDAEKTERDLGGSFPSLRKTVCHLWFGESIWYQRLQLTEQPVDPTVAFTGTFEEACQSWLQQSLLLEEWVKQASEVKLNHTFAFTPGTGEQVKLPVHEAVMHVCNHSTFHRGQLVNMLRQLEVTKIPATDYRRYKPKK